MCNDFYIFFLNLLRIGWQKDQSEASHSMKLMVIVRNLIGICLSTCSIGTRDGLLVMSFLV